MCRFCTIPLLHRKPIQRQLQQDTSPETLSNWGRLTPKRDLLYSSVSDRTLNPTESRTSNSQTSSGESEQ